MVKKRRNKPVTKKPVSRIPPPPPKQKADFGPVLTKEEQIKVIQWLVELKSTSQIVELVGKEFRKSISRTQVWRYSHSKKWRPLINRLRQQFERNLIKIPVANKADRLRYLQQVVDDALIMGDFKAVNGALAAAREEINPAKQGPGGGDKHLHFHKYDFSKMSEEDLINLLMGRYEGKPVAARANLARV